MTKKKSPVDLGSGNVRKLLFSLALPTITSQIVNMLYNVVDRIYIGHMQPAETVGKLALTGVGVCMPIIMLISAFSSREKVLAAYEEAVRERYRFFSFGDAMFIGNVTNE